MLQQRHPADRKDSVARCNPLLMLRHSNHLQFTVSTSSWSLRDPTCLPSARCDWKAYSSVCHTLLWQDGYREWI